MPPARSSTKLTDNPPFSAARNVKRVEINRASYENMLYAATDREKLPPSSIQRLSRLQRLRRSHPSTHQTIQRMFTQPRKIPHLNPVQRSEASNGYGLTRTSYKIQRMAIPTAKKNILINSHSNTRGLERLRSTPRPCTKMRMATDRENFFFPPNPIPMARGPQTVGCSHPGRQTNSPSWKPSTSRRPPPPPPAGPLHHGARQHSLRNTSPTYVRPQKDLR